MQLDMQVKLLRVLQEKVVDPVGSNSPVKVDVRVVAATHQNIESLIKEENSERIFIIELM